MSNLQSSAGFNGDLQIQHHKISRPHASHTIRTPFGRIGFTRDRGDVDLFRSRQMFETNLVAHHYDGDKKLKHIHDLGSGLVTNVGVMSMSNDWNWAAPSGAAINTLKLQNYHATGTGTTAAAATDIALQTLASPTTTTAVTGTQSVVTAANLQKYQTVATINYTTTLAITEWGLHNLSALSATTGTPFTATSGTTFTATATPYTASSSTVQGIQQYVVRPGTTTVWGLVASNTTSVGTIMNNGSTGWWKVSDGTAGSTPGSSEAFTLIPVLWDHKVFSAINVVNGDAITFTYQLTCASGG